MGMSDSHISQSVEGVLLLLILFLTIITSRNRGGREEKNAESALPDA